MDTSDIIAGIALLVALTGVAFTAVEVRRSSTVQRGMLYKDLYERFLSDPDSHFVYGLIEQGEAIFRPDFGTISEKERKVRQFAVERLFAHFEVICSLHRRGLLTDHDMKSFKYAIERVARHKGFSDYEAMLRDWKQRKAVSRGPYDTVFSYVRSNIHG